MPVKMLKLHRWLIFLFVLIAAVSAACSNSDATKTPVATESPVPTPSPTAATSPTPTSVAATHGHSIQVDSSVCQRFFPGVPNPDGPNEWLNISGSVTNPDDELPLYTDEFALAVEVLDADGSVIRSVPVTTAVETLAPGESTTFNGESVNAEHPTATTCRVASVIQYDEEQTDLVIVISGLATVAVEIFAAP